MNKFLCLESYDSTGGYGKESIHWVKDKVYESYINENGDRCIDDEFGDYMEIDKLNRKSFNRTFKEI